MKNLYDPAVVDEVQERIGRLRRDSSRQWGRMDVAQAIAHCALVVEMALGESALLPRHPLGRVIGGWVKRSLIVKGKPLQRSAPTHPTVVVADERDFERVDFSWRSTGSPPAVRRCARAIRISFLAR